MGFGISIRTLAENLHLNSPPGRETLDHADHISPLKAALAIPPEGNGGALSRYPKLTFLGDGRAELESIRAGSLDLTPFSLYPLGVGCNFFTAASLELNPP
jgi:hypothetical protein